MVGIAERNHIVVAGVSMGHEEREVVRLRAGINEVANLQVARHFCGQGLGVLRDVRVQINRGGMLEDLVLALRRRDHVGMTMPDADGDNAAERVEITPPGFVPDVLHFPLHNRERLFVVEKDPGVQEFFAQLQDLFRGRTGVGLRLEIEGR